MLVTVLVTVIMVGVSASHFENGHCEIFRVFCVEFKDILAFFEMEDGNHGVSWAARWIGDGFLSLNVSVTFVSTIMVVMVVVAVFIMIFFIAVAIVVFLMEFHVECGVLGMNFDVISVVFFISEFDVFVRAFGECLTQVRNEHAFVIEGVLASWHGVDFDGSRCVIAQRGEGCFDPWLESQSVVEEHISVLEANEIGGRWFIVVRWYVVLAHVFHGDLISSDALDEFSNVVC